MPLDSEIPDLPSRGATTAVADDGDIPDLPPRAEYERNTAASAAARQQQLTSGRAFDATHPIDARTAALQAHIPISETFTPPTALDKTGQYVRSVGQNFAIGELKLQRALGIAPQHSKDIADWQAQKDAQQNDAVKQTLARFDQATEGNSLPSPESAQALPALPIAAIPLAGPEIYAGVQGRQAYQEATDAGLDPREALARGAGAAAGSELGFRGVPRLAPELAKLGGVTGRLSEGALMGEAMDLTQPNDGQPRTLAPAGSMAALAMLGGRLKRAPVPDAAIPDLPPKPGAVDPSAITQEMPALTEEQVTPPTWQPHGPINTEPIRGPAEAIAREDSTQEIGVENAKIDQAIARLEDKKRILSTGKPVVGPDETQVMAPVQGDIPTEAGMDSVRTISPQDEIKTQAMAHRGFPTESIPDLPTYATASLLPQEEVMREVRRRQATQDPRERERAGIDMLNEGFPPEEHVTQVTRDHIQALRDLTDELKAARTGRSVPELSTDGVAGFETERGGSQYVVNGRSTQRTKGASGGIHQGDVGTKEPSTETKYVTPEVANKLGIIYAGGLEKSNRIESVPEGIRLISYQGRNPDGSLKEHISVHPTSAAPAVGLHPVEFMPKSVHVGSKITKIHSNPKETDVPAQEARVSQPASRAPERPAEGQGQVQGQGEAQARQEVGAAVAHEGQAVGNAPSPNAKPPAAPAGARVHAEHRAMPPEQRTPPRGATAPDEVGPPSSGIAPGGRINERPDLALPSHDPAVRDMMKRDDAVMGRPEERPREVASQEAEQRLAGRGEHEERRLESKLSEPNASLNEADQAGIRKMIDRAYAAGDTERAIRLHRQLRSARTEGARAMGAGVDLSEPPAVRARQSIQDMTLRASQRASMMDRIAEKHGKKLDPKRAAADIKRDLDKIHVEARRIGIDPKTLEPIPQKLGVGAKAVKKAQGVVGARRAKVDADYAKLKDDIKRLWNTKNPSASSTGGALADALTQMAFNRAEAGVLKFSDFVLEMSKVIPGFKNDRASQDQLEQAWNLAREKRPDLGMEAPAERPLDVLVQDAKERAQALADKWAETDAQAKAMTPDERVRHLEQKAAAKQVPQEIADAVKGINEEKASIQQRIRSRDAAILYNHDRMMRIVQAVKGDAWDTYYEWCRSAAHTSLNLPGKKLASDVVQGLYHFGAEAPLARLVNAIVPGGADPRAFKDLMPMWRGVGEGLRNGWANALETWKTDQSALRSQFIKARADAAIRGDGEFAPGNINEWNSGSRLKGAANLIRWNIKSVQAFNDLAETTFSRMAVAEKAMNSATAKGLTGDALAERLAKEMGDLSSESWKAALHDAEHLTGTAAVESKFNPVYWVNRARTLDPYNANSTLEYAARRTLKEAARWTFLFTTLPYNWAKQGLEKSPIGATARMAGSAVKASVNVARGQPWDYSRTDFNTHVAQQVIGYAALGLLAEVATGDDPKVTGYTEWNPKEEDLSKPPAHSIHLFGQWRNYNGLGPVSHVIGTAADMLTAYHNALHGESPVKAGEDVLASMGRQFADETVLRNFGDVRNATLTPNGAARFLAGWATLAYPTMLKQGVKEASTTKEDHRIKEGTFLGKLAQAAAQNVGASAAYSFPSVDIFGNDVLKGQETGVAPVDYAFRLFNPFAGPNDQTNDMDLKQTILGYNLTHPTAPVLPAEPSPYFLRNGKKEQMTREQFHDYVQKTGQKAADNLRSGAPLTDETLPDRVKNAFAGGRKQARGQVVGLNQGGTDDE